MSNKVYKEEINDASDYVDDLSLEPGKNVQ